MHRAPAEPRPGARRRVKVLAALAGLAALLHAGALSGLGWAWPQRDVPAPPTPAMQVRAMAEVPAVMTPAAPLAAERATPPPLRAVPKARVAGPPAEPAEVLVLAAAGASTATPAPGVAPRAPTPAPAEAAVLATPAEETIPHYRTRLPPAVTLRYDMQRGSVHGNGELQWRPAGDRYELTLEGRVAGLTVLTQSSRGGFDSEGMAPLRFTDRRIRRPMTAANFQREAGKITFSGPLTEYPLHPGAQDRLSWMIQLGAIVAAEPALSAAGAKASLFVTGSHGDAGVWVFRCLGPEVVETRSGAVAAVKFRREPRGPYDTTVEVWFDPQRHHLPVRAALRSGPNDEGLELRLQGMDLSP